MINITGNTRLLGIFADPIRHSISPAMHNAAFAELGLDYVYLAFEVKEEALANCIRAMRDMDMVGANISMPYKRQVMAYLDHISEAAGLIGAVNTITNDGGILTGHNTDGTGFMLSLKNRGVDVIGKKITIAGCGGAATAIIAQAALDGVAEISVFKRKNASWDAAAKKMARISEKSGCVIRLYDFADEDALRRQVAESVLLVNGTNVGMHPNEGKTWLSDTSVLREDLVCADLIYVPKETRFLQQAREAGCMTINGEGMLLYQGAAAFTLWTGREMPIEVVKNATGLCSDTE